jgi:hypothetical protein
MSVCPIITKSSILNDSESWTFDSDCVFVQFDFDTLTNEAILSSFEKKVQSADGKAYLLDTLYYCRDRGVKTVGLSSCPSNKFDMIAYANKYSISIRSVKVHRQANLNRYYEKLGFVLDDEYEGSNSFTSSLDNVIQTIEMLLKATDEI